MLTPATGPVNLACRAMQVLHNAAEASKRLEIAADAQRIRQKNILAAFNDKFSYKTL
jgi:hypothetical protein